MARPIGWKCCAVTMSCWRSIYSRDRRLIQLRRMAYRLRINAPDAAGTWLSKRGAMAVLRLVLVILNVNIRNRWSRRRPKRLKPNALFAVRLWSTVGVDTEHLLPVQIIPAENIFIRKILTPVCPVRWVVAGQLLKEKQNEENIFMGAVTTRNAVLPPGTK